MKIFARAVCGSQHYRNTTTLFEVQYVFVKDLSCFVRLLEHLTPTHAETSKTGLTVAVGATYSN